MPGNEKESYVLRRIIRRALYYSQKLHPEKNLLLTAIDKTLALMTEMGNLFNEDKNLAPAGKAYLNLKGEQKRIHNIIELETKKFFQSLKEGQKQLEKIMKIHSILKESDVWNLYSTYGFPTDLTCLIAKEKGWIAPSETKIKQYIKEQSINSLHQKEENLKEQNRLQKKTHINLPTDRKSKENLANKIGLKNYLKDYVPYLIPLIKNKIDHTKFTAYEIDQEKGQINFIGLYSLPENINLNKEDSQSLTALSTDLREGMEDWLIVDKTCFYPEGGGPIGDKGLLETKTGQAEVLDCQKIDELIWLKIKVTNGELKKEQKCKMTVYKNYRKGIKSHHTATHLLNSALRNILGNSVRQKGSLVEPSFLRFDFSHPQALTRKQIAEAEKQVLTYIYQAEEVSASYKTFEQAQQQGYIYLKGENYPSQVRVLKIGNNSSKELCGGVHVKNTSEIQSFKVIKEEGVGSGVRRIIAYTGSSLKAWEGFLIKQNLELRDFLYQPNLNLLNDLKDSKKENNSSLSLSVNNKFKKITENGIELWEGQIEKENPFLKVLEQKEKSLKLLRKKNYYIK